MATVTGLTAERMLEIEGASVVDGEVVSGNLILTKHDGTEINAGPVVGPAGPVGPVGPSAITSIPGEIKLWPNSVLPEVATYGKWVWADGAVYVIATYPKASAHIASQWRTFAGASDPGASNFRVPDLRGLAPVGLDAMPGGARANRMTRAVAITIAGRAGEETHVITLPEMASHAHGGGNHSHVVNDPTHAHLPGVAPSAIGDSTGPRMSGVFQNLNQGVGPGGGTDGNSYTQPAATGISLQVSGAVIASEGNNNGHENVQPTVFVPYIVKLDD